MVFHPFGNETSLPPAGWHSEPNVRGTFSILSTSLLTLFLCVYTVVHTNIPEYEEDEKIQQRTKWRKWARRIFPPATWRRIGWMVMAVLAPELVAWNAFEQRRKMKETTKRVQEYIGDTWTDTHSWFAVMGGFAFDTSNASESYVRDGRRRLTITSAGIVALAGGYPHLLLDSPLTREHIRDRSKANGLTKFLACWQAAWYCVQCIFRLSSGLTITLLELNVFGHAVCALLIYILWWGKPQDVTQSHTFATEDSYEAAEAMFTYKDRYVPKLRRKSASDARSIVYEPHGYAELHRSNADDFTIHLSGPGVILPKHYFDKGDPVSSEEDIVRFRVAEDNTWEVRQNSLYAKRDVALVDQWTFARLNWDSYGPLRREGVLTTRCSDWCIDFHNLDLYYSMALVAACATYGGLHLTAFWATFPSRAEQLLWRMSSLTVVVFGAATFICCATIYAIDHILDAVENIFIWRTFKNAYKKFKKTWVGDCLYVSVFVVSVFVVSVFGIPRVLGLVLGLSALLFYFFCRAFLVVECFISLAYLSPSQLAIPTWSLYVPHLT